METLNIGIIGAGRVGCALAMGLQRKGFTMAGVYSKSEASSHFLSSQLGKKVCTCLPSVVDASDLLLIAVPDRSISGVAEDIAAISGVPFSKKTFMHVSGALSSDVLQVLADNGSATASLHPIQTIPTKQTGWQALDGIYFGFEGCTHARPIAEEIVHAFHGTMLVIEKAHKPLYHAAACIMSNYMVTLSYMAGTLFSEIGINSHEGVKAMMPLMKSTMDNINHMGSSALTGPVSRGDIPTLARHLIQLSSSNPDMVSAYKSLGDLTVTIALKNGTISETTAQELYALFKNP